MRVNVYLGFVPAPGTVGLLLRIPHSDNWTVHPDDPALVQPDEFIAGLGHAEIKIPPMDGGYEVHLIALPSKVSLGNFDSLVIEAGQAKLIPTEFGGISYTATFQPIPQGPVPETN